MGSRGRLQNASIGERCGHVDDAKMTCTSISISSDVNNPSVFFTDRGLLSSYLLRLAQPDH